MVLNHNSIVRKDEQHASMSIATMDRQRVETGTSLMLMLGITVSVGCEGQHSVYQVYIGMNR